MRMKLNLQVQYLAYRYRLFDIDELLATIGANISIPSVIIRKRQISDKEERAYRLGKLSIN